MPFAHAMSSAPLAPSHSRALILSRMSTVYLDAVLEPPRSLSPRGFNRVMLFFGGHEPDVQPWFSMPWAPGRSWGSGSRSAGGLGWCSSSIFRSQTARTYVRVTAEAVDVRKVDGWGRERGARMPSHFARVEFDRTATGPNALRLATSARAYPLGEYLTPRERETLRPPPVAGDQRRPPRTPFSRITHEHRIPPRHGARR